ncbi:NADH dehydrogenase [ubiquinone] 1 beta subcomplex subunit 8, mitochondrial [Onthophagus taurus]|uniref:NADH dehydrogenase [ubiquinone] 1 beta subcomplex subunit 8, mitochondrial n=1 Tax=Onthophagus taurus TaxID=166361 RepID=UPI000C2098DD|nr:NADH dehydrogenase [ubiquinone] 1 beta subcomplex subunit 8, mitochondrial [Onthophagus taurus]
MSLIKTHKLAKLCLKSNPILFTSIRNHWNKDYKPMAYPQTEKERKAAAAKYGLLPEEYKPLPDDGTGLGDYPDLPFVSAESKDAYYPYDFPELKRNFNEPIHAEADMIGEDRYDVSARLRVPMSTQWFQFLGVMFGTFAIYYWLEDCKMFIGQLPKQYPLDDKPSYTFEIEK